MEKVIVATKNQGKLVEIKKILKDFDYQIISMSECGIDCDIEENGTTFEENALIKARYIANLTGCITISDDSGLEVDYLNGAPGIYTARYAGPDATDTEKNEKLMRELEGVAFDKRGAKFVCCAAVVFPDGTENVVRGELKGYINTEMVGNNGFGYDPIFYLRDRNCTTAELTEDEKNKISHRGNALRKLKVVFEQR